MKAYWGVQVSSTHSLTSALDGGEWSALRPGLFTPKEKAPGGHWIGGYYMNAEKVQSLFQINLKFLIMFIFYME
jgi:hypothetical protein